ncbi:MAG: Asp-tRNA(Asn)/Glu-tRNA(Gln) amidotransferase subunit GatC [Spirochaetes bacterium]|nr:Asp-tRNA(Asn)/Glu-tRNA(Gln) amidotransferase subunit GatC [Spirochaetota bacterium]
MAITEENVRHVAKLARIRVDEGQLQSLAGDMAQIVRMVDEINQLDTRGLEPLLSVQETSNVMRDDVSGPVLPVSTIEKLSPKFENGHHVVPAVIE